MIDFGLHKNKLTNGKEQYRATVLTKETYTLNDVIDRMVEQNTTLTRQDIMAVLDLFFYTVMMLVLEGNSVLTPLVNLGVSIAGNFRSADDTFDRKRHKVKARVNASKVFKDKVEQQAQVQQQNPTGRCPNRASASSPPAPTTGL
ncbi:MAG: hypothetical protein H6633_31515 [Anaerolineales bacterium]|nr:hypothetical protein [Anaerolineales bacterium]